MLFLIILGVFFLTTPISENNVEEWFIPLFGIVMIAFSIAASVFSPGKGPGVALFCIVAVYVFFLLLIREDSANNPEIAQYVRKANTALIIMAAIALVPSFFIARYCYNNFDDVVSCRWLYRNSEKDVFESTWKYTINRFLTVFLSVFALLLQVGIIIAKTDIAYFADLVLNK